MSDLIITDLRIRFIPVSIQYFQRDIISVFFDKDNLTLNQILEKKNYLKLRSRVESEYKKYLSVPIGKFLKVLKEEKDLFYLNFLNKNGDKSFCQFSIEDHLMDKGLYCFKTGDDINYIGRCTDSFQKRINNGYGVISATNCFLHGQSTNCHINSLINISKKVKLGVYIMSEKTTTEIKTLEKEILNKYGKNFSWNVQKS